MWDDLHRFAWRCSAVARSVARWSDCCTSSRPTSPPGSAPRWRSPGSPYAGSAVTAATCRSTRRCSPPTRSGWSSATTWTWWSRWSAASSRPAAGCVEALRAGKSVVTANKALLAEDGATLHDAAAEGGADLYYEAASPGRSRCCARCASRCTATGSPGSPASSTAPPTSSSPPWTPPAPASPRRWRRPPSWATPRPTRPPTWRASTPPPRPPSSPRWRSTPG